MSTSGTVGTTTFDFSKLLELAIRRCRQDPAVQTAELMNTSKSCMYLVMTSLANRGLNLWRVEHGFLGLKEGVHVYTLPAGSLSVANINFVNNTVSSGTQSSIVGGYQFVPDSEITTSRVGFKLSANVTTIFTFLTSTDGVSYTSQLVLPSNSYESDTWYWFDLPIYESIQGVQLTSADAFTADELVLSSYIYTIPMESWNRDDYSRQPNRTQKSSPSTNYYFDKQTQSQIRVWPNVSDSYNHLEYWIHRLIQDIDLYTQEIDAPTQWLNSAVWLLAKELCYILPSVDSETKQEIFAEAAEILNQAEMGDTDGSSTYIAPRIGVYTR